MRVRWATQHHLLDVAAHVELHLCKNLLLGTGREVTATEACAPLCQGYKNQHCCGHDAGYSKPIAILILKLQTLCCTVQKQLTKKVLSH